MTAQAANIKRDAGKLQRDEQRLLPGDGQGPREKSPQGEDEGGELVQTGYDDTKR